MYTVEFMNDGEFESLPYREMENKVGVCDRKYKKVYVRSSGVKTLDTFNALHEIEHMRDGDWGVHANHRDPEMTEVYYKGFKDMIIPILGAVASIAMPALAPAFGGMISGVGSGIAGGLGALSPALGGAAASIGAPMAGAGAAMGSAFGAGAGGATNAGYAANAGKTAAGMGAGYGVGTGTATGSAAASAGAAGGGSALGSLASSAGKGATEQLGQNAIQGMMTPKPQPMDSFQLPQSQASPLQAKMEDPKSNVIQPGGASSLGEKVRGFFGGQNPQQEFMGKRQPGMGFGKSVESFGGSF